MTIDGPAKHIRSAQAADPDKPHAIPPVVEDNMPADTPESADEPVDVKAERDGAVEAARSKLGEAALDDNGDSGSLTEERIKKFWESARYARAKDYVAQEGPWSVYVDNVEMRIEPEPDAYEWEEFRGEIDSYTGFKHTFMVDYDHDETVWRWWRWRNHADINTYVIESKFPRDLRVRDIITAYRLILGRNQWHHIRAKRWIQTIGTLVMLVLFGLLIHFGDAMPMDEMVSDATLRSAMPALIFAVFGGLAVFFCSNETWNVTDRFKQRMKAASSRLATAMHRKTSGILTAFKQVCNNASSTKTEFKIDDRDWIDKAVWLTRVAMWLPKRVDYIDRFFQLEMQNIRVRRNISNILGNLWAQGVMLAGLVGVLLLAASAGLTSLGAYVDPANWSKTVLVILALGGITGLSLISTATRNSIQNSDIKRWIGEQTWVNFRQFDMFREVSEIIRQYAYQTYVEDNKGSTRTG